MPLVALPPPAPTLRTFHRRQLPQPAVAFSSSEGQGIFTEALADRSAGAFFRLIEQYHTQDEPAYCGLGTLTMVLNALNVDPGRTWKGPWRWFHEGMLDCCEPLERVKEKGLTFAKVACIARCNGALVEAHRADEPGGDLEAFREAVCRASCKPVGSAEEDGTMPPQVLVVSYSRKQFGQTGDGHYSPIGAYHKRTDRVLILDVARFKHPPHWVPLAEMWEAMRRVDSETGRSRGYMLITARKEGNAWLSLVWKETVPEWRSEKVHGPCDTCVLDAACAARPTLDCLSAAFAEAIASSPLPTASGPSGAEDAAAEVLRRAVLFAEGPQVPLTVVCHEADPEPMAPDKGPMGAEEEVKARARQRAEVLLALQELSTQLPGISSFSASDSLPLPCADQGMQELRVARLLALDLTVWQRALGVEPGPTASPSGSPRSAGACDSDASAARPEAAQAAWELLRPRLELDSLPKALRQEVRVLRAHYADLLTARDNDVCQQPELCDSGRCSNSKKPA